MGTDLFVGFIEKGLRALAPGGKLCYICADRWMQNAYGRKLRRYVLENHGIDLICRMHGVNAFESGVDAYPAVVLMGDKGTDAVFVDCRNTFSHVDTDALLKCLSSGALCETDTFRMCRLSHPGTDDGPWPLAEPNTLRFISRTHDEYPSLEETGVKIGIGVATGLDEVFVTKNPEIVERERLVPLLMTSDIAGGTPPKSPGNWLVNPWDGDGGLVELDKYPRLQKYLESHKTKLGKRHVAKKDSSKWYRTIDKLKPGLMNKKKLLFKDLSRRSEPVLERGRYYPHHNLYWLTSDKWDLESLGGLLISKQAESIVDAFGIKMRSGTMRFQAQYLRMIHVPRPDDIAEHDLSELKLAFRNGDRNRATAVAESVFRT